MGMGDCRAEEARRTSMLAMRTSAHKLLMFCGDVDAQSGLAAYVRATPIFNWIINSIDHNYDFVFVFSSI
jgi:hypothetical protein